MNGIEKRQQKGLEIAKQKAVKEIKDGWLVRSQSGQGFYKVSDDFICECPDSEIHNSTCKHAYAVRYYLDIEKKKPTGTETERIRLTYPQAWSTYNQAQTSEGRLFDELLNELLKEVDKPTHIGRGRPPMLLKDSLFVTMKKIYSQMSSRRVSSLFGFSAEKGHITHAPHFNTCSKLLNEEWLTPVLEGLLEITALPLRTIETDFSIDSSGFRTGSWGAYREGKYPTTRKHTWLKAHICIGTKTNIVTSVKITDETGADSPQFIPLTQKTAENGFIIKEMSADKAYNSIDNYNAVQAVGGTAYIPYKSNTTTQSSKGNKARLWRKMFYYFQLNNEEFMHHYHKRSNVETTFSAIKRKMGEAIRSKLHTAQVNELLCKLIAYNITVVIHEMYELGIKPDFATKLSI